MKIYTIGIKGTMHEHTEELPDALIFNLLTEPHTLVVEYPNRTLHMTFTAFSVVKKDEDGE